MRRNLPCKYSLCQTFWNAAWQTRKEPFLCGLLIAASMVSVIVQFLFITLLVSLLAFIQEFNKLVSEQGFHRVVRLTKLWSLDFFF